MNVGHPMYQEFMATVWARHLSDDHDGVYFDTGTAWFDDLRLTEGVAVRQQVFARSYAKGLVLVKPCVEGGFGDGTATVHRLPEKLRPLHAVGMSVNRYRR